MVCTYTDSAKMVEHFHKGHLETPLPKMNLSLIPGIGGHCEQKVRSECYISLKCYTDFLMY